MPGDFGGELALVLTQVFAGPQIPDAHGAGQAEVGQGDRYRQARCGARVLGRADDDQKLQGTGFLAAAVRDRAERKSQQRSRPYRPECETTEAALDLFGG